MAFLTVDPSARSCEPRYDQINLHPNVKNQSRYHRVSISEERFHSLPPFFSLFLSRGSAFTLYVYTQKINRKQKVKINSVLFASASFAPGGPAMSDAQLRDLAEMIRPP